jgi:hypothetical protein
MDDVQRLIDVFNREFLVSENTRLQKSPDEPLYLPADAHCAEHRILFAHGFFSSALHEISHWCIAGPQRRLLLDYGYWYDPDGRTLAQQANFAKVEARPQALEWIFSRSCGLNFVVSLDNLNADSGDSTVFKQAIIDAIAHYKLQGLPPRAAQLQTACALEFKQTYDWKSLEFSLEMLR